MALLLLLLVAGLGLLVAASLVLRLFRSPTSAVEIRGRHILITGGSSGIGLELAKLAAVEGARKVTLVARNLQSLESAVQQVAAASGNNKVEVSYFTADVLDFAALETAIKAAGAVDVLVCSHGLAIPRAFADATLEEIHKVLDINCKGAVNAIQAALPGMKQNAEYARSIALFSSQAGQVGIYGYAAYGAAKAALIILAQSLRQELMADNIQLSVIYPPDTNTPGFIEENKHKPDVTKALSGSSKAMEARDVARIALDGIKSGKLNVSCNFEGFLLSTAVGGVAPQTSAVVAAVEIALLPLVRFIGLYTQFGWQRSITTSLQGQRSKND